MITKKWQFWLGGAVSVALLLLLLYQVDLGELKNALQDANYSLLAPSIAIYFVAVWFRATRWRYLLAPMGSIPVRRLYPVVIIGYMANNLLPVRLGEVVRSYFLARQENINTGSALATIAVERIYDGITLLAFAALSAPWLLLLGEFDGTVDVSRTTGLLILAGTVFAFSVFLALFTLLGSSASFANRLEGCLNIVPPGLRPKVKELFRTFVAGLAVLNSPGKHLALFIYSLPVWLLEGSMYFMLAYSFGIDEHFDSVWVLILVVLLLTATSNLATSIPSAIGGIGPFEVVAQKTLIALGVGGELALAYSGFVHLIALWLPVNLVGLALLWKNDLSLREITASRGTSGRAIEPTGELS
ncbi:MAG: lysylphosphatidylglycerol synthase transmembrane domain-containing protein [Chloroflexi bacterium]|nr:lysylphosphatidylglycerol synthase transmembrane domain-containing protein [Chloroflexota bacterium]